MVKKSQVKNLATSKIVACPLSEDSKSIQKRNNISEQTIGSKVINNRTPANPLAQTTSSEKLLLNLKHANNAKELIPTSSIPSFNPIYAELAHSHLSVQVIKEISKNNFSHTSQKEIILQKPAGSNINIQTNEQINTEQKDIEMEISQIDILNQQQSVQMQSNNNLFNAPIVQSLVGKDIPEQNVKQDAADENLLEQNISAFQEVAFDIEQDTPQASDSESSDFEEDKKNKEKKNEDAGSGDEDGKNAGKSKIIINTQHLQLIKALSLNHKLLFSSTNARHHPDFKGCSSEYMVAVKNHCNYLCGKKGRGPNPTKIPKPEQEPNPVLVDMFDYYDAKLIAHFAWMLEKCINPKIITDVEYDYINRHVRKIVDLSEPQQANLILLHIHTNVRVRAVACALELFLQRQFENKDELSRSWFNICLVPALKASHRENIKSFTYKEALAISQVSDCVSFTEISRLEAELLCKILHCHEFFSLDIVYKKLGKRNEDFWLHFLNAVCSYPVELAKLCFDHQENLMTNTIFNHYTKVKPSMRFYEIAVKFQQLTETNLIELNKMCANWCDYDLFFELMPVDQLQDFSNFKSATKLLVQYTNPTQREAIKKTLKDLPLVQWSDHANAIEHSTQFDQAGQDSLTLVKDVFQRAKKFDGVLNICDDIALTAHCGEFWTDGFSFLPKELHLTEFPWQKNFVQQIFNLICYGMCILIALGTGHGKSVLIQIIANMLALKYKSKTIIVVCLNEFLAFWSSFTYGSYFVQKQRIRYMSLAAFLTIPVEQNVIVIYDEIEHMLMKSFKTTSNEVQNVTSCFYLPAHLLKWGQFIGFSGTMGAASAQQIRWSFPKALNFSFPSLRKHGSQNKLTEVIKIQNSSDLPITIWALILKMSSAIQNFIIICKDLTDFNAVVTFLEDQAKESRQPRLLVQIPTFESDPTIIASKLKQLKNVPFIAVTLKAGGIAVDWASTLSSHSIMAYTPDTSSELLQNIGRAGRNLDGTSEGSIVSTDPHQDMADDYIKNMTMRESFHNNSIVQNTRIAASLHKKEVRSDQLATLIQFEEQYYNKKEALKRSAEEKQKLWSELKGILADSTMPDNCNSTWVIKDEEDGEQMQIQ